MCTFNFCPAPASLAAIVSSVDCIGFMSSATAFMPTLSFLHCDFRWFDPIHTDYR